jgi:hypothetical protein
MALSVDMLLNFTNMITPTTTKAPFTNQNIQSVQDMKLGEFILFCIIFFLLLYLTMYLGGLIFNVTIVKILPSVKRVSTLDFFGLYVILHILFC